MTADAQLRLFTPLERPSRFNAVAAIFVGLMLPLLAAFIQSVWVWFVRHDETYQAVFHWDNMSKYPTRLVWPVEALTAAAIFWMLRRYPYLQRITAMLLLAAFVAYDFFINTAIIRW